MSDLPEREKPAWSVEVLDLNQGDVTTHCSKHLCDVKSLWHYVFVLDLMTGRPSAVCFPFPMRKSRVWELRIMSIQFNKFNTTQHS